LLTIDNQQEFYDEVTNRYTPHRYFSLYDGPDFIGLGGITNIQWENRTGEISLIINPVFRKKGHGGRAVSLLLDEGFNRLGLKTITGEVYLCNKAVAFWENMSELYNGYQTTLPRRKFWDGRYWDSMYFSIGVESFNKVRTDGLNQIHSAVHGTGSGVSEEVHEDPTGA